LAELSESIVKINDLCAQTKSVSQADVWAGFEIRRQMGVDVNYALRFNGLCIYRGIMPLANHQIARLDYGILGALPSWRRLAETRRRNAGTPRIDWNHAAGQASRLSLTLDYSKSQQLWHAGGSGRAATRCASQREAHHLNCADVNLNCYIGFGSVVSGGG
jgi:hypothetical protein